MNTATLVRSIAAAAAVVAAPVAAHAQVIIMSGGGNMTVMNGTAQASPADTGAKKGGALTADSLKSLHKFTSSKNPIIIVDDSVISTKSFNAMPLTKIASVQLTEASDGDIKFYGDKAKNGILTVKTKAAAAKETPKNPGMRGRRMMGGVRIMTQ
jgi:hypothetical protein